jgi:ATP-dependent helicase/nuclease subunit B
VSTVWTGYGRPAYGALRSAVADRKRADPLAPVTILVPSDLAGVFVRRALARGFGRHPGVAGLTVSTVDRLAERIAAPALAGSGRRPVTEPVLAAAWRRALAGAPGVFGPVADHPATVRALAGTHRELREVDERGLRAIATAGEVQADLVRLHRRVTALLRTGWYDVTDLRRVATAAPKPELGAVLHFLPEDVPPSGETLLATLDVHEIRGIERAGTATTLLHASDADDEVRCVLRHVTAALRTTPAHRIALLHGSPRPYARLLAEHLHAAGIRWNGREVRPTIKRALARVLPGLLETHRCGWQRADVMAVLADAGRGSARWERISRNAGVVGGDDWDTRLKAYATARRSREQGRDDPPGRALRHVDELRELVADLRARLREGESLSTWPALADWARTTYTALVGELEDRRLPFDEARAAAAVLRTLDAVAGLATVEPVADLSLLALTLDLQLQGDLPRHGRTGDGVLVAPLSAAIGLDCDEIFVLGLSEDLVPGRIGADALLPDEVRALAGGQLRTQRDRVERRRRHVWAAFAGAPAVTASYARGDLRRSTARLPSRWLHAAAVVESKSFASSLAGSDELASEQEWRIRATAAGTLENDHVVALGVQMRRARDNDVLTRFDGDLSGHAVPDPTEDAVVSPTSLETWARCPHTYFVAKLLGVRPVESPEELLTISPIELGNLYHRSLDRFFAEQNAAGAVPGGATPWSVRQRAALSAIAREEAQDLAVRGQTGHHLLFRRDLTAVLARLDQFLAADEALRAATGRRQVRSELAFGTDGGLPVLLVLPGGRELRLRGSADRVDVAGDAIVVVDYKSGSTHSFQGLGEADPTLGGTKLQLPAYGYAARQALGLPAADVTAEYWFLHKDAGRRIGVPLTPAVEAAFRNAVDVIASGMAAGLFPHRPPDDDGFTGFVPCAYCDPDGLGTGELRERWARKRTDPRLAPYVAMVEGTAP